MQCKGRRFFICSKSRWHGKYIKDNSYGHCFSFESIERLNKAVDNLWPSINFIINGNYNFVWKPMNYMVNITKGDEVKACLGFEETNLDKIILGLFGCMDMK